MHAVRVSDLDVHSSRPQMFPCVPQGYCATASRLTQCQWFLGRKTSTHKVVASTPGRSAGRQHALNCVCVCVCVRACVRVIDGQTTTNLSILCNCLPLEWCSPVWIRKWFFDSVEWHFDHEVFNFCVFYYIVIGSYIHITHRRINRLEGGKFQWGNKPTFTSHSHYFNNFSFQQ